MGSASESRAALRVIFRVAALALAVSLSVALLGSIPEPHDSYFAAVVDKHKRLVSLPSPKLVIIGGSNAALGIDSRAMQTALHISVVNMGLHAGVGLRFMLDEVEDRLSRGDIVLLTPEYELFWGDTDSSLAKYIAMSFLPDPWNYATSAADYVRYYVARARQKGAVVAFAHPALLDMAYRRDSANIILVDTALRSLAARTGMIVISTIRDSLFSIGDVYDTPYHLNAAARAERTRRLIWGLETVHLTSISKYFLTGKSIKKIAREGKHD